MTDHDYDAGVRDGHIKAILETQRRHEDRLDKHESRLLIAERVLYLIIGAISLIELLPSIKAML